MRIGEGAEKMVKGLLPNSPQSLFQKKIPPFLVGKMYQMILYNTGLPVPDRGARCKTVLFRRAPNDLLDVWCKTVPDRGPDAKCVFLELSFCTL